MEFESYKQFWNDKAGSPESALAAVDGSTDETIVQRTGRFAAAQIGTALDIRAEDHVFELGCGVGRIGRELAPSCAHWTGVDIAEKMVECARERLSHLSNISLHHLERTALPMAADASIDKAYSTAVLCHMDKEDLFLYLEEMHRALKPGGLLFVDTWNLAHPIGWKRWQYEVRFWQKSDQSQRKDVARNQFCTPDELRLYAQHAGFEVLACFAGSHWIQLIGGKDLDPAQAERQRQRLTSQKDRIEYSPLFVDLFDKTVEVIYGRLHPRDALAFLDRHKGSPEEPLYRPFIQGIWKSNANVWGEPDD